MKKKQVMVQIILAIVISMGILICSFILFTKMNRESVFISSQMLLEKRSEYFINLVKRTLENRQREVANLATLESELFDGSEESLAERLDELQPNTVLEDLYLINAAGERCLTNGGWADDSQRECYLRGMSGESGILRVEDGETDSQCICFYVPFQKSGKTIGVLVGCNYYHSMEDLLDEEDDSAIKSYITDSSGQVFLGPEYPAMMKNINEGLQSKMELEEYHSLVEDMLQGRKNSYLYHGSHGSGMVTLAPLGINDWYIVQFYTSDTVSTMTHMLNRSAFVPMAGLLFCMLILLLISLDILRRKYSRREVLLGFVLDRLEDYFPRIVKVDYHADKVEILKDKEQEVGQLYGEYDWSEFFRPFLRIFHPEEVEKCRNYFSLENIRRICEQGLDSDTCTYRRLYQGEYQWMQAIIMPMQKKGFESCALIYVRNVDDSVKAEELHKNKLWELVQQARSAENEKEEYLKYLSEDLKTPIDAVTGLSGLARSALERGDSEEAKTCLNILDNLGKYLKAAINDIFQVGILQGRRVSSRKRPFSLQEILNGCKMYYRNEMQGREESFRISYGQDIAELYKEDQSRLIQVLNALFSMLYRYNRGQDMEINVTLEDRQEKWDVVQIAGRGGAGTADAQYVSAVRALFPSMLGVSGLPAEQTGSPAEMALNSMMGQVSVPENSDYNQFVLQIRLEHI